MIKEVRESIVILSVIWIGLGAFLGLVFTANERYAGNDGCTYRSVLPYLNPGYFGACELTRARFNKEQPVQYVPAENKPLK